jgi:hypothetical protein
MASRSLLLVAFTFAAAVRCALGQGVFVTPVPNVPFIGTVQVERQFLQNQPNGAPITLQSTRSIARDNLGRIYNEFRPLQSASGPAQKPLPVMRVHLYDPRTRMYSFLYPQRRTFWVGAVNRPPATETRDPFASPTGRALPQSQFASEEDLGVRTIAGTQVRGVRETQTIPAAASGTGKDVLVTDEYWYSDELHINMETRHRDPRTGSSVMKVTEVSRQDPDPALFEVPADYKPIESPSAGDRY